MSCFLTYTGNALLSEPWPALDNEQDENQEDDGHEEIRQQNNGLPPAPSPGDAAHLGHGPRRCDSTAVKRAAAAMLDTEASDDDGEVEMEEAEEPDSEDEEKEHRKKKAAKKKTRTK